MLLKVEQVHITIMQNLIKMIYNRIILIVFIASLSCVVKAQDTYNDSINNLVNTKSVIMLNADSIIQSLRSEVNTLKAKEDSIQGELSIKDQVIKDKENEIKRKEQYLIFADTIIARLSNDCLCKKYDKSRVDSALVYFKKMYSHELQKKFMPLESLLQHYDEYSHEIMDILIKMENDKEIKNPFTGSKQAHSYIGTIKSTMYYMNVYDNNWTIPYLNERIDKIFDKIKSFDPKVNKNINLLEIME